MVLYELKKLLSRPGGKIPFILLTVLLAVTCYFAVSAVGYVDENGNEERGIEAVRKRREAKKEWRGNLTEERIAEVIRENRRINESPEGQSQEVREQNKAYYRKQGFSDIRSLIINSYGAFREYDYYLIDELEPERAGEFYKNRVKQLENWLNTEAKDWYTQREKDFFLQRYEMMPQPLFYDYAQGWRSVFEYAPHHSNANGIYIGVFAFGDVCKGEAVESRSDFFYLILWTK